MKLKFNIIFIVIVLLGFLFACEAGTFKPFIRSRYSLRWRKTTETPKVWGSSTTIFVTNDDVEKEPSKTLQTLESSTENSIQVTSIKNLLKTSTHSLDYDYYNNELEEGEHKS